jgi:hypothetical protein
VEPAAVVYSNGGVYQEKLEFFDIFKENPLMRNMLRQNTSKLLDFYVFFFLVLCHLNNVLEQSSSKTKHHIYNQN